MSHEPGERHAFVLRLTTPSGGTLRVGPIATHAEASALARSYLSKGQAIRVELFGRRRGRYELLGIIGQPKPPLHAAPQPDADVLSLPDDDVVALGDAEE